MQTPPAPSSSKAQAFEFLTTACAASAVVDYRLDLRACTPRVPNTRAWYGGQCRICIRCHRLVGLRRAVRPPTSITTTIHAVLQEVLVSESKLRSPLGASAKANYCSPQKDLLLFALWRFHGSSSAVIACNSRRREAPRGLLLVKGQCPRAATAFLSLPTSVQRRVVYQLCRALATIPRQVASRTGVLP